MASGSNSWGKLGIQVPPPPLLVVEAAGQRYTRTAKFKDLGGFVQAQFVLTLLDNTYRNRVAWVCLRRYDPDLFDQQGAPFPLQDPPT